MRLSVLTVVVIIFLVSCKDESKTSSKSKEEKAVTAVKEVVKASDDSSGVKVLNYAQLKPMLEQQDGKTHVVNFWATWCKPCVDELPYFQKLAKTYKDKNVEVLFVSLDFTDEIESKLKPFIKNNNLMQDVVVLDDPNQNEWISGIDESWTGSLPATLIYNKDKRAFYEQPFEYKELTDKLHKFIN